MGIVVDARTKENVILKRTTVHLSSWCCDSTKTMFKSVFELTDVENWSLRTLGEENAHTVRSGGGREECLADILR